MIKASSRTPKVSKGVVGILKIKLGACLTAPTRRLHKDLHVIAAQCDQARNATVRAWLRWREDNPYWQPTQQTGKDGLPAADHKGQPRLVNYGIFPETMPIADSEPVAFQTWLYHVAGRASPYVQSKIRASIAGEVASMLKARTPYTHQGVEQFKGAAIIANEIQAPSFRSRTIPVPCQDSRIVYDGDSIKVSEELARLGESACVLKFPLFSKLASREVCSPVVRLEVGKMTAGNRQVLRRIAAGEWKMADSELVFKEAAPTARRRKVDRLAGDWFLHLVYHQPARNLGLDANRIAAVTYNKSTEACPYTVSVSEKHTDGETWLRSWQVGHGELYNRIFHRLEARRKAMREQSKTAGSGVRGHGRARVYRDMKPVTRKVQHLCGDVAKQTVADLIRFCVKNNCGALRFYEPGVYEKMNSWYANHGLQWEWAGFFGRLKHKCELMGIVFVGEEPKEERAERIRKAKAMKRRW